MLTVRAFLISVFCLLLVSLSYGQSQHPAPGTGIKIQPIEKNPAARNNPPPEDQRGTAKVPLVIKSVPAEENPDQAEENRKERNAKASSEWWLTTYTGLLAVFTFGLIVVGSVQICLFIWQLRLIRDSLTDSKNAAQAALETARAITLSERAYIKISHDPPGLVCTSSDGDIVYSKIWKYELRLEVRNIGKTPAELTRLTFRHFIHRSDEPLPPQPPYGEVVEVIRSTMYGTDAIFPHLSFVINEEERNAIVNRAKNLYVLGVADYIDHFGIRHRAGYARRYDLHSTENNLRMVTWPGYNYDKQRQQGDGYDWNDQPE